MIKAGAFDSLGTNRATLLSSYENILDTINSDSKKGLSGQVNMFDLDTGIAKDETIYSLKEIPEMDKRDLLSMEKDVLGLYTSGHPLDSFVKEIDEYSTIKSVDLISDDEENQNTNVNDGQLVKFIGVINSIKTKITKNNDIMAFVNLEDLYGELSVIVFPKTYVQYKAPLFPDNIVKVEGRINIRDDEISIVAMKIETLNIRETDFLVSVNAGKQLKINKKIH